MDTVTPGCVVKEPMLKEIGAAASGRSPSVGRQSGL